MRTAVLILFLTIWSLNALADELVNLRAVMILKRCDYSNPPGDCAYEVALPQPIQILLKTREFDQSELGEFKIQKAQDGYDIEGIIHIMKFIDSHGTHYSIRTEIASTKGSDMSTRNLDQLGYVFVSDMNKLNQVAWLRKEIKNGDISLTYQIVIASSNDDESISSLKFE